MTEEFWGRFYKYNTTGDAGIVMPIRSYYFRNFFAGAWKDIALGFIHCARGSTGGDQQAVVNERLVEDAPVNLFHFGLTNSVGGVIPVATNPGFVGLRGIISGITQIMTLPLQLAQLYPTAVGGGNTYLDGGIVQMPLSSGVSVTPFSIIGIRLINDVANNLVHLNFDTDTNIALADDAANTTTLVDFLNGISGSIVGSFAQFPNVGLTNLHAFYIYWPYILNRLKLQTVGVIKNS